MTSLHPNTLARAIPASATLAITAKAQELQAAGRDVISLSAGEPDFRTPSDVAAAGIRSIEDGRTRYTAAAGMPELRAAISEWFAREFELAYAPDEVLASSGVKGALHMALTILVEPGDVVLLAAPYWVSYPSLVQVARGIPHELGAVPDQGFIHTGAQIAAAARAQNAKGVILNYPGNPSGAVPTRAQLQDIVDAAVAHDLWILSDEIYSKMLYDDATHVSPASLDGGRERSVIVNGGTKSHSFTGWRIGFLAGPRDVVAAAARVQSNVLGNPCTISQFAAIEICRGDHTAEIARRMQAFDERRRYLVGVINEIDGLSLRAPRGAFYALVDARALCERLRVDDVQLAERLLEEALVATVPGTPFAIPGFIRLSYAASMDQLREAVQRIRTFADGDA